VSSGRLIPVSIEEGSPKNLSAKVSHKERQDIAKITSFIADAYGILINHWDRRISDREALRLLLGLAKGENYNKMSYASGRPEERPDVKTLVLCVGDGGGEVMDKAAGKQGAGHVEWLGWNTDFRDIPGQPPKGIEQQRKKVQQYTEEIIKEYRSVRQVLILAQMDGKASTYLVSDIADMFQKHEIQVISVITDGSREVAVQQQKTIDKATEKLQKQSDLFISVLPQKAYLTSGKMLWKIAQGIIAGLDC